MGLLRNDKNTTRLLDKFECVHCGKFALDPLKCKECKLICCKKCAETDVNQEFFNRPLSDSSASSDSESDEEEVKGDPGLTCKAQLSTC